ncbi:MAG: chemotaxis protein CheW [Pseudomonadota bacterium]
MSQIVTMELAGTALGINVGVVQDVVRLGRMTPVPGAPAWIAGVMNLRGHIVTVIDLRRRMDVTQAPLGDGTPKLAVVVECRREAFALMVDGVGDVIEVGNGDRVPDPATLSPTWRDVSLGVIRREHSLLIEVDVEAVVFHDLARAA